MVWRGADHSSARDSSSSALIRVSSASFAVLRLPRSFIPERVGGRDASGLPGGQRGGEQAGRQRYATDDCQIAPGNGERQPRLELLEEVYRKDVTTQEQAQNQPK